MNPVSSLKVKYAVLTLQYVCLLLMLPIVFWQNQWEEDLFYLSFLSLGLLQVLDAIRVRLKFGPNLSHARTVYEGIVGGIALYYFIGFITLALSSENRFGPTMAIPEFILMMGYVFAMLLPSILKANQTREIPLGGIVMSVLFTVMFVGGAFLESDTVGGMLFVPLYLMVLIGPVLAIFYFSIQHREISRHRKGTSHSPLNV